MTPELVLLASNYSASRSGAFSAPVDSGSVPGVGRSPGEGNGSTLRYSYVGNLMDRGAWWVIVCGVAKELDWLSD